MRYGRARIRGAGWWALVTVRQEPGGAVEYYHGADLGWCPLRYDDVVSVTWNG